jgi:hypothetical protein
MVPAEPFAEIAQPCGERGLFGGRLVATFAITCVVGLLFVGHAVDTRVIAALPLPPRRADHTDWVRVSQESELGR